MKKTRRLPDTIIGQLRWYVLHSGMTQAEIAQGTGIDSGRLSRFTRGERGLSMESLDTLGKYLGLRVVRDDD